MELFSIVMNLYQYKSIALSCTKIYYCVNHLVTLHQCQYCQFTTMSVSSVYINVSLQQCQYYQFTTMSVLSVCNNVSIVNLQQCQFTTISVLSIYNKVSIVNLQQCHYCQFTPVSVLSVYNNVSCQQYWYCQYTTMSVLSVYNNISIVSLHCGISNFFLRTKVGIKKHINHYFICACIALLNFRHYKRTFAATNLTSEP